MIDIKFRGKRFFTGEFTYGCYATNNEEYHAILKQDPSDELNMLNTLVDKNTVGQYTGVKDCNGKEIYFDDVVYIAGYGDLHIFGLGDLVILVDAMAENDIGEILGNIFENPELLDD